MRPRSYAGDLKPQTIQAWDDYVRSVNSDIAKRACGESPFLWIDESPELGRRVRSGEILVASHDLHKVPHGLIHHWMGALFIPNTTLDRVARVLDDYDHYKDFYWPIVVKSRSTERTDDHGKATMSMMQKTLSVTAAVQIDEDIQFVKLDANRIYNVSNSVRVQEIAGYGKRNEQLLPEGRGPGYVWRTLGITRLEQRDGGVYVEMESVALSRGIPVEFRWLINPLTEKLPREIMFDMLNDTGAAVRQESELAVSKTQHIAQDRAK